MTIRAAAAAGVAGPAVFTGAWIVSSLRQTGHGAAEVQISGLAAPDARDPWIMVIGFLVLGGCAATTCCSSPGPSPGTTRRTTW